MAMPARTPLHLASRALIATLIGLTVLLLHAPASATLVLDPPSIDVGDFPTGLALSADGLRLYVVNSNPFSNPRTGTLSVIDTVTRQRLGPDILLSPGFTEQVVVAPDGTRAYVANVSGVDIVELSTGIVTLVSTGGGEGSGIAVSPNGGRVYLSNRTSDTVSVVDTVTSVLLDTIHLGDSTNTVQPFGLGITPDGTKVYVASGPLRTVYRIDPAVLEIPILGAGIGQSGVYSPVVGLSPDGTRAYVPFGRQIAVIDTALDTQLTVLDPFQSTPDDDSSIADLAVESTATSLLVVVRGATNALLRVSTVTGAILGELNLSTPGSLAYRGSPTALAYLEIESGSPGEIGVVQDVPPIESVFFLHGTGAVANPPTVFLDHVAPVSAAARYKDSGSVNFNNGNPWSVAGTWTTTPALISSQVFGFNPLHIWVGLKNSDDQGTQFDVRAEVLRNGAAVSISVRRCITGTTRNPALAKEVVAGFSPFAPVAFDGTNDVLALRISARVGTNPDDTKCSGPGGSHNNATGLRLYFDALSRDSHFGALSP